MPGNGSGPSSSSSSTGRPGRGKNGRAPAESGWAVVKALNYAMPVGIGCLFFLGYPWKINKVGGFALGLPAAAMDLSLRAARHVFGEQTALVSNAWWAPKEKNKG